MLNFFNRERPDINAVIFPTYDWTIDVDNKNFKQWINTEGTVALSINFFEMEPDIPTLQNVKELRHYYRTIVSGNNGGIIEVDLITINKLTAIKTIFKFPQEPTGTTYLASLTIPFKKYSYVIKIQAGEYGPTGMRDSLVADKLLKDGSVSLGDDGIENWMQDPYDAKFKGGTLMNLSESANYDQDFSEHPLTISRTMINEYAQQIEFEPILTKLKRFEY